VVVPFLPDAEKLAVKEFSTLEEISKATGFGPMVKDYSGNAENDRLREDVFDMVRNEVFKEYRDARDIKKFYDDPEKWAQLKTHEKHIANKLAADEKTGGSSLAGKISGLPAQIARAFDRDPQALDERELESLQKATNEVAARLSGVGVFRLHMKAFTKALHDVALADIKAVTPDEHRALNEGLADFEDRLAKHKTWQ